MLAEVELHLEAKREYYGNLRKPMLYGSEQFRKDIGEGGENYFETLLVSVDFSGNL